MKKIAIVSKQDTYYQHVLSILRNDSEFRPTVLTFTDRATLALSRGDYDGWVLMIEHLKVQHEKLLKNISYFLKGKPLVIVSLIADTEMELILKKLPNTVRLHRATEVNTISKTLKKMMNHEKVALRKHPRFDVSLPGTVWGQEYLTSIGDYVPAPKLGIVRSISKGGAAMRIFESGLQVGDKVKLQIELSRLKKKRMIQARIVWIRQENLVTSQGTPAYRIGLKFEGETYSPELKLSEHFTVVR